MRGQKTWTQQKTACPPEPLSLQSPTKWQSVLWESTNWMCIFWLSSICPLCPQTFTCLYTMSVTLSILSSPQSIWLLSYCARHLSVHCVSAKLCSVSITSSCSVRPQCVYLSSLYLISKMSFCLLCFLIPLSPLCPCCPWMLFLSVSLHVFLFFDSLYLSICLLTKSAPFFCPRHCCVFIVFLFFLSICPHPAWLSLSLAVFVPLSLSLSLPLCLNFVFLLSITVNLCVMFVFLSSLGFFPLCLRLSLSLSSLWSWLRWRISRPQLRSLQETNQLSQRQSKPKHWRLIISGRL